MKKTGSPLISVARTAIGSLQIVVRPMVGKWPLFGCSVRPGFGWFRIFGVGLSWKDSTRHELLFSERNGFTRRLRIGPWGVGAIWR